MTIHQECHVTFVRHVRRHIRYASGYMLTKDSPASSPSRPSPLGRHGQHTRPCPRRPSHHCRRRGSVTSFNLLSTLPCSAISMREWGNDTNINGINFELPPIFPTRIFSLDWRCALLRLEVSHRKCYLLLWANAKLKTSTPMTWWMMTSAASALENLIFN